MVEQKDVSDTEEDVAKASKESGAKKTLTEFAETMRKKKQI